MSKKPTSSNPKAVSISEQAKEKQQLKTMKKMDVTHLKQDIHSLRDQLKHLINQKILIQKKMEKNTELYVLVGQNQMNQSYNLEKVSKKQEEELIELENKLKILKNTFSQAEIKKKQQISNQIAELTNKRQAQRQEIKRVLQALSKKVQHLKSFKQREPIYQQKLARLQQQRDYLQAMHSNNMQKIKSTFQSKRQEIKEITNKQVQQIQSTEVSKLRQKLTKEQQIKKENQIMRQEIHLCEEEKIIVENECKLLGDEMRKNAQDDSRMLLGTQATETYERSLRVIRLQGKINKLKQFLQDEMKRLDDEMKTMDKTYDQNQKAVSEKIQKLKTTLNLKQRDYQKVKACSQMVLNQRSNLQAYLLEVFYENAQLNNQNPSNVNEILRKLFIKINSKKTPISYKNYMNFDLGKSGTSYITEEQYGQ